MTVLALDRRARIERARRRVEGAAYGGPEWDAAREALDELERAAADPEWRQPPSGHVVDFGLSSAGQGGSSSRVSGEDRT